MSDPGLSVQRDASEKMPLSRQKGLEAQLLGILGKYKSGALKNMIPLKDFFAHIQQKGNYAELREIYEKLDDENKEIFRKFITYKGHQEMIFGKGKGIPFQILEIISSPGKPAGPRPVTVEAPRATLQAQGADRVLVDVVQPLSLDRILVTSAIENNPFLRMFSDSIVSSGTLENYSTETVLIEQNSQPGKVYAVLKEGSVKVEILDSTGNVLKTIYPPKGALVGERSVMLGTATNARVTVLSGAKLLSMSGPTFMAFLSNATQTQNFQREILKTGISPELAREIVGSDVSIDICRPGETLIIKGQHSSYMYIVLDGELGVFDYFGETRGADGNPVKIIPGQPVGEMKFLNPDQKAGRATVANTGNRDVVLLKIPKEIFDRLMASSQSEFKKFIMKFYEQRSQTTKVVDFRAELRKAGFEYEFEGTSKDGRKVSAEVQKGIFEAAWEIRTQILAMNPGATIDPVAINHFLKFICSSLELQHLDNPLKYVSHGADHSLNTMLQTIQLISGSKEVQAALGKCFGSGARGTVLAQLVALFHDIGYPEVTRLSGTDPGIPKFRHQEFSADLVRKSLPYEILSKIIPGLTPEQYSLFITAIEHHGSDSLKPSDIAKGRPFRVAALGDNPLLVLMKLSDNLDMLNNRLNAVQSDSLFLEALEKMKSESERITREYKEPTQRDILLAKRKGTKIKTLQMLIEESNKRIITDALKRINGPDPDNPGMSLMSSDPAKYKLMEGILQGCNHESYEHFASVDFAHNISVTIENGSIKVRLIYNTPLQYIPLEITDFQTGRLADSQKATILDIEKTKFYVEGVGEVEIRNGEVYLDINDGKGFKLFKVTPETLETAKKIQEAIYKASQKPQFTRLAPAPTEVKLQKAKPKVKQTEGIRSAELAIQYRVDHTGAFGPEYMQDRVSSGKSRTWLVINSSGLKNVNDTYGHEKGNAYLQELCGQLQEIATEINATIDGKVRIVRQGPNFVIELPEGINPQEVLERVNSLIQGRKIVIDIGGNKKLTIGMELNYNILVFNAPIEPEDVKRAVSDNIHYLNKGEKTGKVEIVDDQRIKRLRLSESVVDPSTAKGLEKYETFEKRAIEGILKIMEAKRSGRTHNGSIASFDGNWTGAFRDYGLAGEAMIDALFERFIPEIADEISRETGIKVEIYRWGAGSEEFYIYADGADAKTMQDIMKRFMEKVATKPFKMRIPVLELQITSLGRDYLEGRSPGTEKPTIQSHEYSDKKILDVVEVDVIQLLRGRNGLIIKGLPITAAMAEIVLPDIPISPDRLFAMYKELIDTAGVSAKGQNGTRGNLLVRLVAGGKYEIFVSSENEFRSPEDIGTRYRTELLKKAEDLRLANPELARVFEERISAMTPEELAQITPKDILEITTLFKDLYEGKEFGIQQEKLITNTMRKFGIPEKTVRTIIGNIKIPESPAPIGKKAASFMTWIEKTWTGYGNKVIFLENVQIDSLGDYKALKSKIELLQRFKVSEGSSKCIIISGSDVYLIEIPKGHKLVQKGAWLNLTDAKGNTIRKFTMQGKYLKEIVTDTDSATGSKVIRIVEPGKGIKSYNKTLLLKQASLIKGDLGERIRQKIREGSCRLSSQEMVQLVRDLKSARGTIESHELEIKIRSALRKLSFNEIEVEGRIDQLKWDKLKYRFGSEVVNALRKALGRVQGTKNPTLKGINLLKLISNIFRLSGRGNSSEVTSYFGKLGLTKPELDKLRVAEQKAKEHYEQEVKRIAELKARQAAEAQLKLVQEALDPAKEIFEGPDKPKVIADKIIEYLKTPEGRKLLETEKGRELLAKIQEKLVSPNFRQALKLEGGGLIVGLITLIGVEKFVEIMGVQDKKARFALVLGLSHMANMSTQDILAKFVLGEEHVAASRILKAIENPTAYAKFQAGLKGMAGGLAEMAFVSMITKGILDYTGVQDPALRAHITLGTSFVVPAAARFGYGRVAAKFGESALARTGVGIASKALGRVAGGIGLASLLTDGVYSLFASDYRLHVNNRAYIEVQTQRAGDGAGGIASGFFIEFFHTIGGSAMEAATTSDNPGEKLKIIQKDIEGAESLRRELGGELQAYVANGGDLTVLAKEQKFVTLNIPTGEKKISHRRFMHDYVDYEVPVYKYIQEKDVYSYMFEYAKSNPQAQFGSQEHIQAVISHFDNKISAEDCKRIFEKGILISWQMRIASLHMIDPSIFSEFESSTLNNDIRNIFNANGTLKSGKESALLGFIKQVS